ncbi:helix-turn-helix transcriptional regulator [Streptomyces sp. NPDC097619]|uniref:helix-turn-helix transcriptional regulator n=1 Tax=Streptomyces sp. NPDC097619 TaxID=3157228 RepID=UPI003333AF22
MHEVGLGFLGVTPETEAAYRRLLRSGSAFTARAGDTTHGGAESTGTGNDGPESGGEGSDGPGSESKGNDGPDAGGVEDPPGGALAPADATAELTGLGLATETPGGIQRPVAPATAVEHLVARLVERRAAALRAEYEERVAASGIVDSLLADRDAGLTGWDGPDRLTGPPVRQLDGLDAVRAAIDELTFHTRAESLTVNPVGVLSAESIAVSRTMDLRVLRRGVRMRTVMAAAALHDPPTLAYLRELTGHGAEVRLSHRPLDRMIICDRAAALTPVDPADTLRGALLVRGQGLVGPLLSLFERMWDEAVDLPGATAPPGTAAPLTPVERRILDSLHTADKDESGARELGISVRTYRKHVAALMQRLGAVNRFQAALRARERGWL